MDEFEQNILSLLPEFIFGAEDDDDPAPGQEVNKPGVQGDPNANNDDNDDDSDNDADKGKVEEESGLKKALAAERKLAKEARAEAARVKAENEALKRKDMDEIDRTKAERDEAQKTIQENTAKLEKLANGFRRSAIVNAITAEAIKQGFIDPSDALAGVDEDSLGVEQDEDDPSQVTIDPKAVTSAVKKLATSKPHYINKGTNDGDPTGSAFGGSRKGNKQEEDEATLRARYPNL